MAKAGLLGNQFTQNKKDTPDKEGDKGVDLLLPGVLGAEGLIRDDATHNQ